MGRRRAAAEVIAVVSFQVVRRDEAVAFVETRRPLVFDVTAQDDGTLAEFPADPPDRFL